MKKLFAILLASLILIGIAHAETRPMVGGWNVAENTEITEKVKTVFEKALEGFVGVNYQPVAYLGHQVVAGMNHCILCKATVVYPDSEPSYVLMYIYEHLDGNTEITKIEDLNIAALSVISE